MTPMFDRNPYTFGGSLFLLHESSISDIVFPRSDHYPKYWTTVMYFGYLDEIG